MSDLSYFLNTCVAIFVIVDPFALVPVYLTLSERFTKSERKTIRIKASLVGLGLLLIFTLTGTGIFKIFGITMPAFRIAGGILLLIFGIRQLNAKRERVTEREQAEGMEKDDIAIFPLAMPMIAGPGAISTVILYSTKADTNTRFALLCTAIIVVAILNHLILYLAPALYKFLGKTGLNLITRIMGLF